MIRKDLRQFITMVRSDRNESIKYLAERVPQLTQAVKEYAKMFDIAMKNQKDLEEQIMFYQEREQDEEEYDIRLSGAVDCLKNFDLDFTKYQDQMREFEIQNIEWKKDEQKTDPSSTSTSKKKKSAK